MKKCITLFIVFCFSAIGIAQHRPIISKDRRNIAVSKDITRPWKTMLTPIPNTYVKSGVYETEEEQIGETRYDNQSNASIPKKIYLYSDGTIAATWTRSMLNGISPDDRGTGYNYFDGTEWGDWPEERIEDIKTHRPTYAPFGSNGELVVSHVSMVGLYFSHREEKGTGDWEYESFPGPSGNPYILWNRMVTSGPDRDRIHILALTFPTQHGGSIYEGMDGALLYSLSLNGGNSWVVENEILEGMTQEEYAGFDGDNYAFAEPRGDVIAFAVGGAWCDLFLMKSIDGGETFTKTVVWQHPYPMWQPGMVADTFYCADGAHSLVIDDNDMVHMAFGITRLAADAEYTYWYESVDGIAYWHENMPPFSDNLNALSPYGDPGTELVEDYNLIGWTQDVNGNGQIDIIYDIGYYWLGLSSMPQLVLDDQNRMFLVYSSVTEIYHNNSKHYRHLWTRASPDGGMTWGAFTDITIDFVHVTEECVYPACSPTSDDHIYLVYQADSDPGTATWGSQHEYQDNKIIFSKVLKADILISDISENSIPVYDHDVSQNYPNPFNISSEVKVHLRKTADLYLFVTNLAGQKMFETCIANAKPGIQTLEIDGRGLSSGLYFYTVKAGTNSATRKMIVE